MNKYVYIVKESWVCDTESNENLYAFSNKEKAKKKFDDIVNYTKCNCLLDTIEDDSDCFCTYEDGNYAYNHTIISMFALPIQ